MGYFCSAASRCESLGSGLLAHWRLDEAATPSREASGSGWDGLWEGAPVLDRGCPASIRFPNPGCLRFIQTTRDRVHVARVAQLEPRAVTVSLWVKREDSRDFAGGLISKSWQYHGTPTLASYSLILNQTDWSKAVFQTGHKGTLNAIYSPAGAVPIRTWVHIAGVYDPSGPPPQKRLYVSGVLSASTTLNLAIEYDASDKGDLYFGELGTPLLYRLIGYLDDIRIFDRALTDPEIGALAAGQ